MPPEDITNTFAWIRQGTVARYVTVVMDGWRVTITSAVYTDQKTGRRFLLSGSVSGINEVLKRELGDHVQIAALQADLPTFLAAVYNNSRVDLLDHSYVDQYKQEEATQIQLKIPDARRKYDKQTESLLEKLCIEPSCKQGGGRWEIVMRVITLYGAVEEWVVAGPVAPVAVDSISTRLIEAAGSVKPIGRY